MLLPNPAHSPRAHAAWVAGQAGFVLLAIFVYFQVRGLTEGDVDTALENSRRVRDLEAALGLDVEAAIQEPVLASETTRTVANWVYIWGHWPVIAVVMVWLAWRHRLVFLRLRDAMVVSGLVGMVVFALFPVAPPRLADVGLVDTITEESSSYRVLQPPNFTNQYAAMPSLHAGWDLLVGMAVVAAASSVWLRLVGATMPVLMAFAVVATGNHYVLDAVAGIALVLLAHLVALRLDRRRRSPREGP